MATIRTNNPQMRVFEYFQNPTDSDYGSCLWARFYFDLENYTVFITSDCGEYSHTWPMEKIPFLSSLLGMKENYLLEKLSRRNVLNKESSLENLKEMFAKNGAELIYSKICKDISFYLSNYDVPELAIAEIERLIDENSDIPFSSEEFFDCFVYVYPAGAYKIVEIFETYIKPEIKKFVR